MRNQLPELEPALRGRVTEHHRWMLNRWWEELAALDERMAKLEKKIAEVTHPYASQLEQMDPVPGVDRRVAEVVLADVGPDMKPLPTDAHGRPGVEWLPAAVYADRCGR